MLQFYVFGQRILETGNFRLKGFMAGIPVLQSAKENIFA